MSFEKTGIVETNKITENGMGTYNFLSLGKFDNYSSGTITGPSNGKYTVTSPSGANATWGAGFSITNGQIIVPYGCIYRIKMEVFVPTAHGIQIDINNTVPSGVTIQGGNDNDNGNLRTSTYFSIPANTWTEITWGSINTNEKNTHHVDISVYDGIGLKTNADTAAVTWYMRNPRAYIGFNTKDTTGVASNTIYTSNIYEY